MVSDIFDANVVCGCGGKTKSIVLIKNGFKLRAKTCVDCGKKYYHPLDLEDYKNFSKLKKKDFNVKLRMVGNSFCVSIPREIINFEEEMMREMNDMIKMCLEGPEKLGLYFSKKMKRRL